MQSSSKYTFLIAEDNPMAAHVLKAQLLQQGHSVQVVQNGRLACEIARRSKFHAIIMDCQMPEMDGLQATRALCQHFSPEQLPIIAVTANQDISEESCREAGMNGYMLKPVDVNALLGLLCTWLAPAAHRSA